MKLRNKLLTVLPIATIGVITPITVSSCSCSDTYTINYGDSVNCKDKDNKSIKYRSPEEVKNASVTHIQYFEEKHTDPWTKNDQTFYYDIVYSLAKNGSGFVLTWKSVNDFSLNGKAYNAGLSYAWNDKNEVIIKSGEAIITKSEACKYCTK